MRYRPALLVVAVLAACAGHVCMLCLLPMMDAAPADDAGLSSQRIQQGISRSMGACLDGLYAQEINAVALECTCEAERACTTAGLDRRCAWDDWVLETRGHHMPIVGRCEDR